MARPKKDTPEGKKASEKWHSTMLEKYGNITEKMAQCGRIGGMNGKGPDYKGGFAADHERARIAGAKGGSISKRTTKYQGIFSENSELIKRIKENKNTTIKATAKQLNVPYTSLLHYIKKMENK